MPGGSPLPAHLNNDRNRPMKHHTFFWFILPSLAAMILFIALPIVSVFTQSLFVEHKQVLKVTENCGPFGCKQ